MFPSYFIEHFYDLPVYFLGFDFFLLYITSPSTSVFPPYPENFESCKKYFETFKIKIQSLKIKI